MNVDIFIQVARLFPFKFNDKDGILISTADIISDQPNSKSQSDDSNFLQNSFRFSR
tara:strand:- start:61 stop:228 length:168 start_codon:yes stop_codon:yes gene_type:complete